MLNSRRSPYWPYQVLLLITYMSAALLVVFILAIATHTRNISMFFNSDTLYISSIYLDLFVHGSGIEGWHLNAAPNFFPEMAIYLGIMGIIKGTALTSFVYSILQTVAVMVLLNKFLKTLDPGIRIETLILVNFSLLLLLSSATTGEDLAFPFQILISGYHCGFFINVLMGMIAGFQYIRKGNAGALVFTGFLVIVAVVSDKLFLMGFVAPLLIVTVLSILKRNREKRFILLMGIVLACAFLGLKIFSWMDQGPVIHFFGTRGKMFAFENMQVSFKNLMDHMILIITDYPFQRWLVIFTFLFTLSAPIYLLHHIKSFLKDRLTAETKDQYTLILYIFIFTIAIFFTPVINGYYLGAAHIRYNFPALILGSAGFIYFIVLHTRNLKLFMPVSRTMLFVLSGGLLVFMVYSGMTHSIRKGVKEYIHYYPYKSQILDKLKESHDLKYGISNYWHAKHITMFSRNGIRVYSVHDEDLKPYYHVTNENWYHDGGKGLYANPVFNFVYADAGYDSEGKLTAIFGRAMDTIYAQDGVIVIKLPDFKIDRVTREMKLLNPELEN